MNNLRRIRQRRRDAGLSVKYLEFAPIVFVVNKLAGLELGVCQRHTGSAALYAKGKHMPVEVVTWRHLPVESDFILCDLRVDPKSLFDGQESARVIE